MARNESTLGEAKRSAIPTIMVITHDLKLLKLLDMGLKLELACDVLGFTHTQSAEETAKRVKPDLLILDDQLLNHTMHEPDSQPHSIQGLEQVPTLLVNAATVSLREHQSTYTIVLTRSWQMEELYAAVHELLDNKR